MSSEEENSIEICCLIDDGAKCKRPAGNASFSKRIQKTLVQKKLKLTIDVSARSQFICDTHKLKIQSARTKRTRPRSDESESDNECPVEVEFYSLQVQTLRRYKKFFKVSTRPGLNKAQLAEIVSKHFKQIPVNEKEVLTYFIYSVKQGGGQSNGTFD